MPRVQLIAADGANVGIVETAQAKRLGVNFLRFDYSGHGQSSGHYTQGTISQWLEESLDVIEAHAPVGKLVLVGSSMGGWIGLRLVEELKKRGRSERIGGLILIAPAADFTEKLMWPNLTDEARRDIVEQGVWLRPSAYDDGDYPITRGLIEDGARWSILPGPVGIAAPVRILQGGADPDVPWRHALALAQALEGEDVVFSLIRDGDHRLSRPQDIARLIAAVEELASA